MYLLDTHALLWFLQNDKQLGKTALEIIEHNDVCVSMASLWEIAIKNSLGKLELPLPFDEIFPKQLLINDIAILPIELMHLKMINKLDFYHRDPFDRLIIAQALNNDLTLISKDGKFADYDVNLLW
ncbi:type II toxin-antitoxin system VapC family toxin [Moraxella nasibovis]|uniref:type II toxin-antitoxin system VapC family toxin n=1 Tax=Moraxella nasibovis TaxID=2904120 RepID=UPI00240F8817|nr:type II toxin-antitoxin system VapC family toxin [Moraxella nasibovis]WFF39028.1 type II toxin-antitoxin system VapC family toxin [Moraxella nasibovis]